MVATGVANHAGAGVAAGIPRDWGNHYLIGIEMESSGIAPWDWTPEQLYWAPRLGAALEQMYLMGLPEDQRLQIAHYEYSSQGKIDPAGWPGGMDGLRASINAILSTGSAPAPAPKPTPAPVAPKPAPVAPSKGNGSGPGYCIVERGDTLWGIAKQFGTTVKRIEDLNPGVRAEALNPGQRIFLLNHCFVEAGDTLSAIASQFGFSLDAVKAANPGINHDRLTPGQVIYLE
jgi:LysM repeat protein